MNVIEKRFCTRLERVRILNVHQKSFCVFQINLCGNIAHTKIHELFIILSHDILTSTSTSNILNNKLSVDIPISNGLIF